MGARAREARKRAREIISRSGINMPPVPVDDLARDCGIHVQYVALDDELSGMAFVRDGMNFIVVNSDHHPNRQRFTLAHELGHHILHRDLLLSGVHVDKGILRRDLLARAGTDPREIAANAFAAEILMPEALIGPYITRGLDLNDETVVEMLARKFEVSSAAIHYRLFLPAPQRRQGDLFKQ